MGNHQTSLHVTNELNLQQLSTTSNRHNNFIKMSEEMTELPINQKEYLKKYLAIGKAPGEKRKRKKKPTTNRIQIIDDDAIPITDKAPIDDDVLLVNEDAPQIVAIIDERPPSMRIDEKTKNPLWQPIGTISDPNQGEQKQMIKAFKIEPKSTEKPLGPPDKLLSKKKKHLKKDQSPPRRKGETREESPMRDIVIKEERKSVPRSEEGSPPRRIRDDSSPPRRRRDEDMSPARRSEVLGNDDYSPPRKNRRRDSDSSPPRRKNQSRSDDISPPRRREVDRSDDISPPRRREAVRSDDISPPRRRGTTRSDDMSPPRRREAMRSDDMSPPRRNKRREDFSPPRRRKEDRRGYQKHDSPPRRFKGGETPPKRQEDKGHRNKTNSPPRKIKREIRSEESNSRMDKTLDGKSAGLQNARELIEETRNFHSREDNLFKSLSKDVSGETAHTVHRDRKTGKVRNLEEEEERQREKREEEEKNKEKYERWGRGLAQVESREQQIKDQLHEMSKPLARYADDEDLEKYLKEQEREGDPMLAYIRKKKKKKAIEAGEAFKPQFEGEFMPNRYGIRPGHRWDGVDRGNGYERKWFEVQNEKKALQEESYKWSTEDM